MSILSALSISRTPALAFVVVGLFWGVFAAYVPEIKAGLGAGDALFGILLLGSATGLLSAMWVAPRADRMFGPRAMQVGAVALALAWLLPARMDWALGFAAAMALVGVASGLLDVVMNARVSELEARHGRALMNANHAMFSLAYAAAAVASGFAREAGIAPATMLTGLGLVIALLVPFLRMAPAPAEIPAEGAGRFPVWPVAVCGAIVLTAFMSEAAVEAWSALHLERTLGGRAAEGVLGPAMLGLTMAVGRFSGQAVADRFRETTVAAAAACVAAIGALAAAVAPTPLLGALGFGVMGLGVSVIGPLGLAIVGRLVAPHRRTEAIGRTAVIGFSGFFLAPVLMGTLSEVLGLRGAFVCVALLLFGVLPLTRAAGRIAPQPASRPSGRSQSAA